jgi:hypothetical protein
MKSFKRIDVFGPLGPLRRHARSLTRDEGQAGNLMQALARFDRAKAAHWGTVPLAPAVIGTGSDRPIEQAAIPVAHELR